MSEDSLKTDFFVDPYFDDFDEDKKFHRILFRPGFAVQARELTQMQTILQDQVRKFGSHIFQEGSIVKGTQIVLDYGISFAKLANTAIAATYANTTVQGVVSSCQGKVFANAEIDGVAGDPPTIFVKFLTGDKTVDEGFVAAFVNTTAVTANTSASAVDDTYNGNSIKIISGTGSGQVRLISDYIGASRTVEVSETWTIDPDVTSRYQINETLAEYVAGEELFITTDFTSNTTVSLLADPVGDSSGLGVTEGVVYNKGFFAKVSQQFIILDKYTRTPTATIGLTSIESIVTADDDSSLLDPASGSFNENAPGSDRFKLDLVLSKKANGTGADAAANNFIELAKVDNGDLIKVIKYPTYSDIMDTLSRRTFDESGSYTVTPFQLSLNPKDVQVSGSITSATSSQVIIDDEISSIVVGAYDDMRIVFLTGNAAGDEGTISTYDGFGTVNLVTPLVTTPNTGDQYLIYDDANFVAELEAGKAYVKGREIETISTTKIVIPKARDTEQVNNFDIFTNFGSFLKMDSVLGFFDVTNYETVYLHNVPEASVSTGASFLNDVIGTARVRQVGDTGSDEEGPVTNLHMFDFRFSNTISGTVASSDVDPVIVNLEVDAKHPTIDDIYNGATITVVDAGITDVREILDYVGSTREVTLASPLQNATSGSATYTIAFNAKNIRSVTVPDTVPSPTVFTAQANTSVIGKVGSVHSGTTVVFDTDDNTLVLPIPNDAVKTIRSEGGGVDSDYRFQRSFTPVSFTAGVGAISTATSDERFVGTGASDIADSLKNAHYFVTVTAAGTSAFAVGDIIDFTAASRTINIPTPGGASVGTATFDAQDAGNFTGFINASIDINTAQEKIKTLITANTTFATGLVADGQKFIAAPNIVPGSLDSLEVSDVAQLVAVYDSLNPSLPVSNTMVGNSAHEVTSRYTINTGQKDNYYDHGNITLRASSSAPTGQVLVIFDHFTHSGGKGYFSVDSYTNINYEDIPTFTSPTTGDTLQLRDVIDFRPKRQNGTNDEIDFTLEGGQHPIPTTSFEADYSFYIGRVDTIVALPTGEFEAVSGISAFDPSSPKIPDDSMALYQLEIPPFTFNAFDVRTRKIENKRYTMRDIGNLEKRIDNLEYYTSLSLLEQTAADLTITDANGLERFKNGILVDNFKGHGIGDVLSGDYNCSTDPERNELRPSWFGGHTGHNIYIATDTILANRPQQTGDILTVPYTLEKFINQPLASRNSVLNPFNKLSWIGTTILVPERDDNVDINTNPDVKVNLEGDLDAWEALTGPTNQKFSTEWNSWNTRWSGKNVVSSERFNETSKTRVKGGTRINKSTILRETTETSKKQTRNGIRSQVSVETVSKSVGDRIVDVSVIPFIRSQYIAWSVKGMKPNTRLHAFFDEVNVDAYVGLVEGTLGTLITTDSKGNASGVFLIPRSNVPSTNGGLGFEFRVGERIFLLIDDLYGRDDVATTFSEVTFVATGLKQTRETTYISTRVPRMKSETVSDKRTLRSRVTKETVLSTSSKFKAKKTPKPKPPSTPVDPYTPPAFDAGYGQAPGDSVGNPSGTDGVDAAPGEAGPGGGGGGGDGSKIICTEMNRLYGFGSYRNAIWLNYAAEKHLAPEWELGYHKLFYPLVARMETNKYIRIFCEWFAKGRTDMIRREMRGTPTTITQKLAKAFIMPIVFVTGWLVNSGIISKSDYNKKVK